ncbi:hypothetical protein RF11_04302 [Thelohanellus kitauei]|uniref:Uncharacterized protein n=1 Tax=Thelohanellus kitauei TaxID=669202 RepID=A0A0C2J2B0_THEKT|nr:hypothetical protein RF11_04302 [Thelohanellus kitauei]
MIIDIIIEAKRRSNGSQRSFREICTKEILKVNTLSNWMGNPFMYRLYECWTKLSYLNAEDIIRQNKQAVVTSNGTDSKGHSDLSDQAILSEEENSPLVPVPSEEPSKSENITLGKRNCESVEEPLTTKPHQHFSAKTDNKESMESQEKYLETGIIVFAIVCFLVAVVLVSVCCMMIS